MRMTNRIYEQAGCIPWRRRGSELEVALITSLSSGRWIIPKGLIDPGESARQTAAKETLEESGLTGDVTEQPVGSYEYFKWGGVCRVQVYLLRVERALEQWDESFERDRRWFTIDDAADSVRESELRAMIRNL